MERSSPVGDGGARVLVERSSSPASGAVDAHMDAGASEPVAVDGGADARMDAGGGPAPRGGARVLAERSSSPVGDGGARVLAERSSSPAWTTDVGWLALLRSIDLCSNDGRVDSVCAETGTEGQAACGARGCAACRVAGGLP
jgi:hypothetical protein